MHLKFLFHLIFSGAFFLGSIGQTASTEPKMPEGQWLLRIQSDDVGVVNVLMDMETEGETFEGHTRKGAAREMLGFWPTTLGKIFTSNFKKGSLMQLTDGQAKQSGDTLKIAAILRSALGSFYFNGYILKDTLTATIRNGKKQIRGKAEGWKKQAGGPLMDYPALVEGALDTTKSRIFNRAVTETSGWEKFTKKIRQASMYAQDDLEMVFSFFYHAGKLPVSHYALLRLPKDDGAESKAAHGTVTLTEVSDNTALLSIRTFGGTAQEMDSIFKIIKRKNYTNLVVDLRGNPGGSVAAGMKFATNVADAAFYGGVFLTQKWFNQNPEPPKPSEYNNLPHFTEANFDLIIEGIHNQQGLCLKVEPEAKTYTGRLFILVNPNTASTCEPIVYGLKGRGRATIVGETTAGAMLNGEVFKLENGYSLIVPTADYYAADGYRIDQRGVEPDVKVNSEDALEKALELIQSQ